MENGHESFKLECHCTLGPLNTVAR